MSLLNDVLQDLDARDSGPTRADVRTASSSVREHAADDFAATDRRVLSRPTLVGTVLIALLATAWLGYRAVDTTAGSEPDVAATAPEVHAGTVLPQMNHALPPVSAAVTPVVKRPQIDGQTLVSDTEDSAEPAVPATPIDGSPVAATSPDLTPEASVAKYLPLRNDRLPGETAVSDARLPATVSKRPSKVVVTKSIRPVARDPLASARQAIARGDLAEAESVLQQRLRVSPRDIKARELLVGLMVRGGRGDDALRELTTGLKQDPAHGKFILIKARLLAQADRGADAIRLLERSHGSSDIRGQRLQMLGALYQQRSQYAEAVENYRTLLSVQPDSAAGWVGLAICLDAQGKDGAGTAYRRALGLGGLPATAAAYARQRLDELE